MSLLRAVFRHRFTLSAASLSRQLCDIARYHCSSTSILIHRALRVPRSLATSPFVKPSGSAFVVGSQKYYVSGTNFFNAIQNDSYTQAELISQLETHWNNGARRAPIVPHTSLPS